LDSVPVTRALGKDTKVRELKGTLHHPT